MIVFATIGGGWYLSQYYEVDGLDQLRIVSRDTASDGTSSSKARTDGDTIRIGSFNIQTLGRSKMSKANVVEKLAQTMRHFDIVAIQEIRSRHQDIIPRLVEYVNAKGGRYDFVLGPRVGRTSQKEQFAYIFDTGSVEVDRAQVYTIADPRDLLHRPPLVAWFRVRGIESSQAFTFSLINVHLDPDLVAEELSWMAQLFRAVRDDGRGEDDVILMGDFNANDRQIASTLRELPGAVFAIQSTPTNTRLTQQYDNLIVTLPATEEYTGESGTLDLLREFNLSLEDALEISDHIPVWASFYLKEGGASTAATPSLAP